MLIRPLADEYDPYFQGYIDLVPDGNITSTLRRNSAEAVSFFSAIPAAMHQHRYAPEKWSIQQVLMHITDVERVMTYRALVAARGDTQTVLYSMDDHLYQAASHANERSMESIIAEFASVRGATISLFYHITAQAAGLRAQAGGHPITARALAYIITGHMLHHMAIINTRYRPRW